MREALLNLWNRFSPRLNPEEEAGIKGIRPTFFQEVEAARQEWLAARTYFESVTEPELVDHAIYLVEAAEKKYMYLLKKAREQGLASEITEAPPNAVH